MVKTKRKPGRPPLPDGDVMPQISLRMHQRMLDTIDSFIKSDRHGEGDRASIIREAVAAFLGK